MSIVSQIPELLYNNNNCFNFMQVQAATALAVLYFLVGIAAAGKCGVNGPELALSQLNRRCTSHKSSRSDACASAIHRFCQHVIYGGQKEMKTLGVSQTHESDKIFISCVKAEWSDYVHINDLQKHDKDCTVKGGQGRHCLAASHRFCQATLKGRDYAGTVQEVTDKVISKLYVQCFKPSRKEHVLHNTLQKYHSCQSKSPFYNIHTDNCYAAASEWCRHVGQSGGIPQEVDKRGVTVACYKEEFSNWAHVERTSGYFTDEKMVTIVCDLNFKTGSSDINIRKLTPELLQTQVYDNRGSEVTLHNSFKVSQQVTESTSFTHSHSFTISGSATTKLDVNLPYISTGGSVSISTSVTTGVSLTEDVTTTKTYENDSPVVVPPGKAITMEVIAHIGDAEVPWNATVITGLGHETTIDGKWRGIQAYNIQVEQTQGIQKDGVCKRPATLKEAIAQLLSIAVRK